MADEIMRLIEQLSDADRERRIEAARMLGKLGASEAVPGLMGALHDADGGVRQKAAVALGQIGSTEAVPGLLTVLQDPDAEVRRAAVWSLGQIGHADAVPDLIKALKDSEDWVRRAAATALGQIADSRAVEPLGRMVLDREQRSIVRIFAARALGEIGDPQGTEYLNEALKTDPESGVKDAVTQAQKQIQVSTRKRIATGDLDIPAFLRRRDEASQQEQKPIPEQEDGVSFGSYQPSDDYTKEDLSTWSRRVLFRLGGRNPLKNRQSKKRIKFHPRQSTENGLNKRNRRLTRRSRRRPPKVPMYCCRQRPPMLRRPSIRKLLLPRREVGE